MSRTAASFNSLREAITSLWDPQELGSVDMTVAPHVLLLTLPTDVVGFSVLNSQPDSEYNEAYSAFKKLYRDNTREAVAVWWIHQHDTQAGPAAKLALHATFGNSTGAQFGMHSPHLFDSIG
jgi:hypothetical protein